MRRLFTFLSRPRWSELAIETYERQISLAERQKNIREALGSKWAGAREKEVPHRKVEQAMLYSSELHFEFGPPPRLKIQR